MARKSRSETRPSGETTGTSRRPKQQLAGQALAYGLDTESEARIREALSVEGGRAAKTLAKVSRLHVVLTALRSGTRVRQHETHAPISVQGINGSILVHLPDQQLKLKPGMVMTLQPDIPHDLEAEGDSAFLLTVAWARETSR